MFSLLRPMLGRPLASPASLHTGESWITGVGWRMIFFNLRHLRDDPGIPPPPRPWKIQEGCMEGPFFSAKPPGAFLFVSPFFPPPPFSNFFFSPPPPPEGLSYWMISLIILL